MQIEHDPNERRPTNAIWWALLAVVALQWTWYFYFFKPDWIAVGMGAFTAGVFISWVVDITGNKWPFSGTGQR
ncbi:hypothetical protein EN866_33045 [Mesorhizobium sp. M2D.F.Ca.ET.223.01.1.1]|uniref:hypothetical protein n=1 Tax=Mesorhizobium sp. M2D.F.Ca.ET.223.01.1.1 TaxID=2563940 RepID=UPI0010923CA8|nr:hypothetical protein [Mesorhizobium sp. M2D.F.Ca.ET.223.01.1.1]TGR84578.1 hypothetical protein EN866_33045 [Mesorhizobium sp. M2D.F.Ca.ET.223.01.1.1]TGT75164.1 hypothetical protein EN802_09165 [bacterium M00.F.Ca.ET.159.01.1.1]TGT88031.1 hypothetical protein EN800_06055 [bacterium M00.F.Ca.ET.157.01.1.1]